MWTVSFDFGLRESPGLNDLPDQVGAHQHGIFPQQPLAPRAHDVIDHRHADGDQDCKQAKRLEQRPDRCSASRHDDQLAVAAQLVQDVEAGDQQGDRRDQRQQAGDRQRRHDQKAGHVLALAGHQLELAQRHRDPHDGRERHENEDQGSGRLPENVAAENPAENAHPPPAPLQLIPIAHASRSEPSERVSASHSMVAENWPCSAKTRIGALSTA